MKFTFEHKRISGILAIVPANEQSFLEDMKNFNFPEARSRKLMEVMGYDKHRLVRSNDCVSDLAVFGIGQLFERTLIRADEIDALIVVTQSPDHFMPPTSNIVQGRLNLKEDAYCIDINQGCAGYVIGLIQAFLLLEQRSVKKIVLVNADILSRKTSSKDRNSYPLIGDGAAITVVERGEEDSHVRAVVKMDGTRREALMIPAGGFRMPSTPETSKLTDVGDNNLRSLDHLRMDGGAVFNFVQAEVPPLIDSLLAEEGVTADEIDYFVCHQPNRFMLQKLADKMRVPYAKMPMNIVERFGNGSGITIPTAIAYNLRDQLITDEMDVCLAGFGVGLTWAAMLMRLGRLNFCDLIEYPEAWGETH